MASNLPNPDPTASESVSQPEELITIPKTSMSSSLSINESKENGSSFGQPEIYQLDGFGMTSKVAMDPRGRISSLLKDKEQEWTAVVEKQGPLRLLDLPMDVLKEIVKEVGFPSLPIMRC
jgi:hypothetical protein